MKIERKFSNAFDYKSKPAKIFFSVRIKVMIPSIPLEAKKRGRMNGRRFSISIITFLGLD